MLQDIQEMADEILKLGDSNEESARVGYLKTEIKQMEERERNWILALGKTIRLFKRIRPETQTNTEPKKKTGT